MRKSQEHFKRAGAVDADDAMIAVVKAYGRDLGLPYDAVDAFLVETVIPTVRAADRGEISAATFWTRIREAAGTSFRSLDADQAINRFYNSVKQHGVEAFAPPAPTGAEAARSRAALEQWKKTDPEGYQKAYWADPRFRDYELDLIADAEANPPQPPPPTLDQKITKVVRKDRAKYERMLRDSPQEYWGSREHQEAFHQCLADEITFADPAPAALPAPSTTTPTT